MLKITVQEETDTVILKLEGRIAGPGIAEIHRAWRSLTPALNSKKLVVDLRGVSSIDGDGELLMGELYAKTGAEFQTSSVFIEFLIHKAIENHEKNGKEHEYERSLRSAHE